jgi:hypothetical protein
MYDAFRRLGADVRAVGPDFGSEIWGMTLAASRAWKSCGTLETAWKNWTPDLVYYSSLPPYAFNPVYRGVPHVVHAVDNHVRCFRQEGIDHYFMAHRYSTVMSIDGPRDTWLPCAYDPEAFTPSPIPFCQREFDVALVGVMYPHRQGLIDAMREAGFKVAARTGAVYDEYRDIYHNSRISLCLSYAGDVAMRIFETAAMKCVVLSDSCEDFAPLQADGIVIYQSVSHAVRVVKQLLANPEMAEGLIERSSAWAKPHTWDARARVILDWLAANPRRPDNAATVIRNEAHTTGL